MDKYYTPEIEDLCVGFEYEMRQYLEDPIFHPITAEVTNNPKEKWHQFKISSDTIGIISEILNVEYQDGKIQREWIGDSIRVKYLDKEDIESLGFIDNNEFNIPDKFSFYKNLKDNILCKITTYWDMDLVNRENLIRIFIGYKNNYPYTEIFKGNVKNKSELRKLIKMLNID